eukprot:14776193-Heterocapsa_arctica.AAC.1
MEEDEAQGEEITCGVEWEGGRPRMMANPHTPSRIEVDEHMAAHIPYRAWCPHCVIDPRRIGEQRAHTDIGHERSGQRSDAELSMAVPSKGEEPLWVPQ